ncbi:hypothetical protein SK128_006426 [Halocaridina rubra]|uniref:m7GpppX diphosphatase n=1 Tax=Halocaridina rubra TaxID=373956 RepID=A0AAN8XKV2_HALRR
MTEFVSENDSLPPCKRMRTDDIDTQVDTEENGVQKEETSTEKPHFTSFENFEVVRILNNNEDYKTVSFQAQIRGKEGMAVVTLQKVPFSGEKLNDLLSGETKLQDMFENDIYYNKIALLPPALNELKATIIYPAEEKHLLRFDKQPCSIVNETPELFFEVTKPYIESAALSKQWIYNILEHKTEVDRIVYEDPDPEIGFILVPDLKWTGKQVEDLYLQAVVHRRDITCIRDLRRDHIPLLKNIYEKGTAAVEEKYGLPAFKQRVYIHYQPSFYHLHIHFTALSFDAPGTWAGKAYLLESIISNLQICEDYYKKITLPFTIKDNHPLRLKFLEKGVFCQKSPESSVSK